MLDTVATHAARNSRSGSGRRASTAGGCERQPAARSQHESATRIRTETIMPRIVRESTDLHGLTPFRACTLDQFTRRTRRRHGAASQLGFAHAVALEFEPKTKATSSADAPPRRT